MLRNVADEIATNLVAVAAGAGIFALGLKIVELCI